MTNGDMNFKEPTRKDKLRAATMALIVLVSFACLFSLVGVSYLAYKAYDQSSANGEIIQKVDETTEKVDQTNDRLLDCTEPGGKCFESGQERTAEAVVGINEGTYRVVVAALSCQEDGVTATKPLARCTAERAPVVQIPRTP